MTTEQMDSWRQACRALFGGFVASAPAKQLSPSVSAFWDSDQKDLIRPSLEVLLMASKHRRDDTGNDDLQRVLFDLLNSVDNEITRMKRVETDDIEGWRDVEWELTKIGNKMFP